MDPVTLRLQKPNDQKVILRLALNDTPLSEAVIQALQTERESIQAIWSGKATCIALGDDFPATEDSVEGEPIYEFDLGDVALSPNFNELILAYGPVEFYDDEAKEPVHCIPLGKVIDSDIQILQNLGEEMRRRTALKVSIPSS